MDYKSYFVGVFVETVARRYYFTGRVQGVGFRYTTVSLASDLPVNGFVRNLPDGRVELHVEANMAVIEELLKRIQDYFRTHIQSIEAQVVVPEGYRTFSIQRDS